MQMDTTALRALIESDAQALAHFTAGRDVQCAERCSDIAPTVRQLVPADEVHYYAAICGAWAAINLAWESETTPAQIRGICITFRDWVKAGRKIDFDMPEVQQMMGGLVQSGVITQQQSTLISGAANVKQTITANEVSACRQ